jgi:hypothetical protein
LYVTIGDDAKAEPLLEEALRIDQKALGPEHHDTACWLKQAMAVKIRSWWSNSTWIRGN